LNNSVEDRALIRPENDRPCFLKANEGLNLYLQIVEDLGFVFEKNLIVASDMNDDGLCLVNKGLISARVSLTTIQDFLTGLKG